MALVKYQIEAFTQAKSRLSTIRDFLRFAVSQFQEYKLYFGHGTENAYDEAAYLILHTLNLPLEQLEPYLDAKLIDIEIEKILHVLHRRVTERIPASYITHEANFLGYTFYVDERVIIPRSYIGEVMLNGSLEPWIQYPELINSVLDLCTGNGSLAVIAADYFCDAQITAVDLSQDALDVAKINVEKYELNDKVTLCQSDLFANLGQKKYDLIVTNPPYVDKRRMEQLPKEYLYEPNIALAGGNDGLDVVDKILKQSSKYLNDFGVLVLEMGDNKWELEERYPGLNFAWLETENNEGFVFVLTIQDLKDYFGKRRKARA